MGKAAIPIPSATRFGRLTVMHEEPRRFASSGKAMRYFAVRCDCGIETSARIDGLQCGDILSCGCLRRERAAAQLPAARRTHCASRTSLYGIWSTMKSRCTNEKVASWKHYGARGIKVCAEWLSDFEAFAAYVGPRPAGKSIDRIDNDGDYRPGNVRWATAVEQAKNRRRPRAAERNP